VSQDALARSLRSGDHRDAVGICLAARATSVWRSGPRLIDVLVSTVLDGPGSSREIVNWALWRERQGGRGVDELIAGAVIAAVDRPHAIPDDVPRVPFELPTGELRVDWYCLDGHTAIGRSALSEVAREHSLPYRVLDWLMFNCESTRLGPEETPGRWKDEALALDALQMGWGSQAAAEELWATIGPEVRRAIERRLAVASLGAEGGSPLRIV
jgi:hypothetical protein